MGMRTATAPSALVYAANKVCSLDAPNGLEDMTWMQPSMVYYLIIYWAFCVLVSRVYTFFNRDYSAQSIRNKRNLNTYVLEVVVTTVSFVLSCGWAFTLIMDPDSLPEHSLKLIRVNILLIVCLYVYELIYKLDMNLQLLAHHVLTIGLAIITLQSFHDTFDRDMLGTGLLCQFTANTEQMAFIALTLYRFKHRWAATALRAAAIQSVVFKTCFIIWAEIKTVWIKDKSGFTGQGWYTVVKVIIVGAIPLLYVTQIYGAWIMWKISYSKSLSGRDDKDDKDADGGIKTTDIVINADNLQRIGSSSPRESFMGGLTRSISRMSVYDPELDGMTHTEAMDKDEMDDQEDEVEEADAAVRQQVRRSVRTVQRTLSSAAITSLSVARSASMSALDKAST